MREKSGLRKWKLGFGRGRGGSEPLTGEVPDGKRHAGEGSDADVVAEVEVGDGGRGRGVALDDRELGFIQKDSHGAGEAGAAPPLQCARERDCREAVEKPQRRRNRCTRVGMVKRGAGRGDEMRGRNEGPRR